MGMAKVHSGLQEALGFLHRRLELRGLLVDLQPEQGPALLHGHALEPRGKLRGPAVL